jgi:hypothetical protein
MGLVITIVYPMILAAAAAAARTLFPNQNPGGPAAQEPHEAGFGLLENLDFHFVPAGSHLEQGF